MLCIRSRCTRLLNFSCIRNISDKELFDNLSPSETPKPAEPPKKPNVLTSIAACMDLVRLNDYEHFMCICVAPTRGRISLTALRAFNVEISKSAITPYSSSEEKALNKLKLEWWRSTLDVIYKDELPKGSPPVAVELSRAVRRSNLTKGFLIKLIESRSKARNFTSLLDVEEHAENTFTALNILSAEVFGYKSVDIDHAASHLGRAEGHIGLIRSIPLLAQKGACIVPATTLSKTGVSQTDIIRGENRDKIKDVIHEIASSAHVHLDHSEKLLQTLPAVTHLILLNVIPARVFLKRLQKHDFDIFSDRTLIRAPTLPFILVKEKARINFKGNMAYLSMVAKSKIGKSKIGKSKIGKSKLGKK